MSLEGRAAEQFIYIIDDLFILFWFGAWGQPRAPQTSKIVRTRGRREATGLPKTHNREAHSTKSKTSPRDALLPMRLFPKRLKNHCKIQHFCGSKRAMPPLTWSRGWYDRGSAAPGGGVGEGDRTSFYHYLPRTGEIYVLSLKFFLSY